MHEISLVRNLISNLEAEFTTEELLHLNQIDLHIGKLSNAEPQLLQNAFAAVLAEKNKYKSIHLHVEIIPIEIYCSDCNTHTLISNYRFICSCGKPNNNVVRGTEMFIHQLHFDD